MTNFKFSPGLTQRTQAHRCQQELHDALERSKALEQASLSADLAELLRHNGPFMKGQTLAAVAQELDKLIATAITFELVIPTEPTNAFLQDIAAWFRSHLNEDALLVYKIRRDISGGAIVRTPNRIYDFSFRPKIQANKSHLLEVIRNV